MEQHEYLKERAAGIRYLGVGIPEAGQDALIAYVTRRRHPGGFLTAILENDLREAFRTADDTNAPAIGAYVAFLYNYCPSTCWGSKDRVKQYLDPAYKG